MIGEFNMKFVRQVLSIALICAMIGQVAPCATVNAKEEGNMNFDSEYVLWTDEKIIDGFWEMDPDISNKITTNVQNPYGNNGEDYYDAHAYYEFLWTHGYPIGNGRMAAMVMGAIDKEVIQINEDTIWNGSPYVDENGKSTAGSVKDSWKYFRGSYEDGTPAGFGEEGKQVLTGDEEFRANNPDFAHKTISNMSLNIDNSDSNEAVSQRLDLANLANDYFLGNPVKQRAYSEFAELYLDFNQESDKAENYSKRLDMREAIATVEYDYDGVHFTRESFASYPDQAIVTNIKSSGGEIDFSAQLHTWLTGLKTGEMRGVFEKISDNEIKITVKPADLSEKNGLGNEAAIIGEARMYITAETGASFRVSDDSSTINVKGGNEATVYIVGASNYVDYLTLDNEKPAKDCDKYISKIKSKDYDSIKAAHIADYKELFERSKLSLENNGDDYGDTQTEKRVRKDVNGKSGFTIGAGNKLAANTPVDSTYNDGDNKLIAMMFNYGKYLMIAGSREGDEESDIPVSQPLNLTGKWNGTNNPSWAGKYTININTEMNYWPSQPLNLSECITPLVEMLKELAENGSITAAYQYGITNDRGDDNYIPGDPWVMHNNTDIWRGTQFVDNGDRLWPIGGAWLMDCVWKYYQYNLDAEYLVEIYPIMRGLAYFYTKLLVIDPVTGYLIDPAAESPEQGGIQPGAAINTQLIRNLYDMVLTSVQVLGKQDEEKELVSKIKEQMPENGYFSAEKGKLAPDIIETDSSHSGVGNIREWVRGDVKFDFSKATESNKLWTYTYPFKSGDETENTTMDSSAKYSSGMYRKHTASNGSECGHRHCSHLWELFPGTHINAYSSDENEQKIYKAFQNSVLSRGAGSGQGWGVAWRVALSARAHDATTADSSIEQLLRTRTSPNLFDQHPNFQIDGNYGLTAGITEMLVQKQGDSVEFLPAISEKWQSGSFEGFKMIGNIEAGAVWSNGKLTKATLKSANGGTLKARNSAIDGNALVIDSNNNKVEYVTEEDGTVIAFEANAGETYTIYPADYASSTGESTWEKYGAEISSNSSWTVKNNSGSAPKYYADNLYIGNLANDNSYIGFAVKDCNVENLQKLGVKIGIYPAMINNSEVSVRIGSKNGVEIAHKVFDTATGGHKSFAWIDIPLNEDVDQSLLSGTKTLYFLFKTDLINDGTNNKYIANVEAVSGTVSVETGLKQYITLKHNDEVYYQTFLLNGNYIAQVANDAPDGTLVVASYKGDELINFETQEINSENRTVSVNVGNSNELSEIKFMYWDNLNNMQPLSAERQLENDPYDDPEPSTSPTANPITSPTAEPIVSPTETPYEYDPNVFTVDGSKETDASSNVYSTIREALSAAAEISPTDENERISIEIVPGTYREQLVLNTPYITLKKKADTEGEVLCTWYYGTGTMYKNCGEDGFYRDGELGATANVAKNWGATLTINKDAHDVWIEGITLENSYNQYYTQEELNAGMEPDPATSNSCFDRYKWIKAMIAQGMSDSDINAWLQSRTTIGTEYNLDPENKGRTDSPRERACALYTNADKIIIRNCKVISKQDTIGIKDYRVYFENCFLEGTTDYICSSATAVMNNCTLNIGSAKPMSGSGTDAACITAAGHSSGKGYVFYNCEITGTDWATPSEFGRPWNANAEVVYINTRINKCTRSGYTDKYLISDNAWTDMGDNKATNARFGEYGSVDANTGKAISINSSLRKQFLLDEWTMLEYNPYNYLRGDDGWDPSNMEQYYSEFDSIANSIDIDTSQSGDIALPTAPSGYEYMWMSCSPYASVDNNSGKISLIRPAYGESPISTDINVYIRKIGTEYGAIKTIPLTIQPYGNNENTFNISGTATIESSEASSEELKITISIMQGECLIKSQDVVIFKGESNAEYKVENLPEGTYTIEISTNSKAYILTSDTSINITGSADDTKTINITLKEYEPEPFPAAFTVDDVIKAENMMRWSSGKDVTNESDSTNPRFTASSASTTNLLVKMPDNYTKEYVTAFGAADDLMKNYQKKLGYINFCSESDDAEPSIDTYLSVYFSVSEEQAAKGAYKVYILTNRKRDSRMIINTPKGEFIQETEPSFVNMSTDTDGTGVYTLELPEFTAGTYEFKWYPVRTADGKTKVGSDFFALKFLPIVD